MTTGNDDNGYTLMDDLSDIPREAVGELEQELEKARTTIGTCESLREQIRKDGDSVAADVVMARTDELLEKLRDSANALALTVKSEVEFVPLEGLGEVQQKDLLVALDNCHETARVIDAWVKGLEMLRRKAGGQTHDQN